MPHIDIYTKNANWADSYFALWRHFTELLDCPVVGLHDMGNAWICGKPVQKFERLLRQRPQARLLPCLKGLECMISCRLKTLLVVLENKLYAALQMNLQANIFEDFDKEVFALIHLL